MPDNILGRALSIEETAQAASKPLESLPFQRLFIKSLSGRGIQTVGDLASAPLEAVSLGPIRLRRVRQILLTALADDYSLNRLAEAPVAELPERVNELLGRLEERRRGVIERTYGLWTAGSISPSRIAKELGAAPSTILHDAELAAADLRRLLRSDSAEFKGALRSMYIKLLSARQGMAGFTEWSNPASSFYQGQEKACLAFSFLCRLAAVKPQMLVTVGLDHVCYDNVSTKYRHDQAMDVTKTALLNLGRPMPLAELGPWLKKENRIDATPDFLRRCFELSRELGIEKSGAVGLRSWSYFDAHSLHAMAHAALASIQRPVRYEEIARKIDELYPHRAPVNRASLHTMLCVHKEEFVPVRYGGIFGLPEWELRATGRLKDFLTDFMRENGGSAKRQELVIAAQENGYKAASVGSILHANKDLFRRAGWGHWELAV